MSKASVLVAPPAYEQTVQAPHRHQFRQPEERYAHKWNLLFTVAMLLFDIPVLITLVRNGDYFLTILSILINAFLLYTAVSQKATCLRVVEVLSVVICFLVIVDVVLLLAAKLFFEHKIIEMLKRFANIYTDVSPDTEKMMYTALNTFENNWSFIGLLLVYVFGAITLAVRAHFARKVIDEQSDQKFEMRLLKATQNV